MKFKIITIVLASTFIFSSCKKEAEATVPAEVNTNSAVNQEEITAEKTMVDPNQKFPKMEFTQLEHDFGTISPDKNVETTFEFTNTGEADLLIATAVGSCGCTVPEYPKTPIAPGEKGNIKVSFSPQGKTGMQNKTVTLTTNTLAGTELLTVKANIVQ